MKSLMSGFIIDATYNLKMSFFSAASLECPDQLINGPGPEIRDFVEAINLYLY
jgi:hypothetical protein